MICRECREEGLKSKVYIKNSIPHTGKIEWFYDEDGNYHIHDESAVYTHYKCSNGHKIRKKFPATFCLSCDFGEEEELK